MSVKGDYNFNKNRINWIDYAKAIAIFLVIMGHVSDRNFFTEWVYSFHMPLFFFLSGITLKKTEVGISCFIKKLTKRLLIPYFCYSGVYLAFIVAKVFVLHKNINIAHAFLGVFLQIRGTEYSVGLWFLPLLFLSEIFVYTILNLSKRKQYFAFLMIIIIGFLFANNVNHVLPWGLDVVPISSLFIWIGYTFKSNECCKKNAVMKYKIIVVGFLLINISMCLLNINVIGKGVDMYYMRYGNPIYYILASIFGILFIVFICKTWLDHINIFILQFIGQNTLHIYCIHGLIIAIIKEVREKICGTDIVFSVMEQMVIASITLLICLVIILLIKKIVIECNRKYCAKVS